MNLTPKIEVNELLKKYQSLFSTKFDARQKLLEEYKISRNSDVALDINKRNLHATESRLRQVELNLIHRMIIDLRKLNNLLEP